MRKNEEKPIYIGDTKATEDEKEWVMSFPMHELDEAEMRELGAMASETYKYMNDFIGPRMTRESAERIRELRCETNWSFRLIAGLTRLEWGLKDNEGWNPPTNQIAGMVLCEQAAKMLGEDHSKYPWEQTH